jgi:hypothetical protein
VSDFEIRYRSIVIDLEMVMNVASRIGVFGAIVMAGACDAPTAYRADGLRATVSPPQLALKNTSNERIAYVVVEQEFAALALFACYVGADGPLLAPSGEVKLQYSSIPGYEPGKSKVALIWFATVTDADVGCIDAARVKSLSVNL